MGKEEDTLLLFLSMEKPDLESPSGKASAEEYGKTATESPRISCPVFWRFVAVLLLVLAASSGVLQFCTFHRPTFHHAISIDAAVRMIVFSSMSFGVNEFSEASDVESEGDVVVHEGRAYLTSRLSTDTKGVVAKTHSVGRLLYPQMVRMKYRGLKSRVETVASFHTTFVFSIENSVGVREATGDGFAFIMVPQGDLIGSAGGNLGMINEVQPSHAFAIEFDTWKNPSLHDISNNHVGINLNSMVSISATDAGYWTRSISGVDEDHFQPFDLTSGKIQAWIDYDGMSRELSVSVSPILGWKPPRPLLKECLDLSKVLLNYMSVGFSAATGDFSAKHVIHSWRLETSGSLERLRSTSGVQSDQLESSKSLRHWRSGSGQRDQVSRLPVFRYPRKPRHGESMKRKVATVVPTLVAKGETVREPILKKPCTHLFRDFSSMDFSAVEDLLQRWFWVFLVVVAFVVYHVFLGCFDMFCWDRIEESHYDRVVDAEKETGYVLIVS